MADGVMRGDDGGRPSKDPAGPGTPLGCAGASLGALLGVGLGVAVAIAYTVHSDDDMGMWAAFLTVPLGASLGALAVGALGILWAQRHRLSLLGKWVAWVVTAVNVILLEGGLIVFLWRSGWGRFLLMAIRIRSQGK
jgi:hypothetical protein